MKIFPLLLGLIFLASCTHTDIDIEAPTSDGCSLFPNGTRDQKDLWLACCEAHDLTYWQGGTCDQRLDADRELRNCVARVGKPGIGLLMFTGVRVGGTPYLPTAYRWGFGWPYPRGYKAITPDEQRKIDARLRISGSLN